MWLLRLIKQELRAAEGPEVKPEDLLPMLVGSRCGESGLSGETGMVESRWNRKREKKNDPINPIGQTPDKTYGDDLGGIGFGVIKLINESSNRRRKPRRWGG
jgi:hypothetical protein